MISFLKTATTLLLLISMLLLCTNGIAQTKSTSSVSHDKTDSVFSKVEIEASFPGGPQAWTKYVTNAIEENQGKLRKSDYGTCIIKFIVDIKGHVRNVEAITMKKSRLAKIAIEAITNGPRWNPAQQDGRFVNAYRLQPVTLTNPKK
ncbi:MAG: energy transducer TonB [Bacteroidota bacterium]|nr:energy transducer TonB [Bacteroidota bacterium]